MNTPGIDSGMPALPMPSGDVTLAPGPPFGVVDNSRDDDEKQMLAAAIELLTELEAADQFDVAADLVSERMRGVTLAQCVMIGYRWPRKAHCELVGRAGGTSNLGDEARSRFAQSALDEVIVRAQPIEFDLTSQERNDFGLLAVKHFVELAQFDRVIASPLRDAHGNVCGAWMFLYSGILNGNSLSAEGKNTDPNGNVFATRPLHAIELFSEVIGVRLHGIASRQPSKIASAIESLQTWFRGDRSNWLIAGLIVLLIGMLFPIRYPVRCDCTIEPMIRRYVAAPFDGTLREVLVEPGDTITEGQTLAWMDARELDWELSGLEADRSRADKERKVSIASGDYASAQIAELEVQRIKNHSDLLTYRIENLELRSPISGVVVSGDNKRSEGAPLSTGQSLFEIAPLGEMIVEFLIPESDFPYVAQGMPVKMRLSAFPSQLLTGTIQRVHPKAEINDNENVFIAEMLLEDRHNIYRPGMRGRATVLSVTRPFIWTVMHKPWNALLMRLGL